jgi:hypothetical protein
MNDDWLKTGIKIFFIILTIMLVLSAIAIGATIFFPIWFGELAGMAGFLLFISFFVAFVFLLIYISLD